MKSVDLLKIWDAFKIIFFALYINSDCIISMFIFESL